MIQGKWSFMTLMWAVSVSGIVSAGEDPSSTPHAKTLQETLQAAYSNSLEREAAQAGLQAGYEGLSATTRDVWAPTVQLKARAEADFDRIRKNPQMGAAETDHFQTNGLNAVIGIQKSLYEGGGGLAQIESAAQDVKALEAQAKNTIDDLLFQSVKAHAQVWAARRILTAAKHKAMAYEKQLEVATVRYEAGDEKRSSVEAIRAKYEAAQADYVNKKAELQVAVSQYIDLVGEEPGLNLEQPQMIDLGIVDLEAAVDVAMANNASLAYGDAQAMKAEADRDMAQSKLLPNASIGLQGTYGLSTTIRQQNMNVSSRDSRLGVWAEVVIPVDLFGTTQSVVRSKNYTAAQKKLEARNSRRVVAQKVTEAWAQREKANNALAPAHAAVKAAKIALSDVQEQYAVGEATYLNVIEAEDQSYEAETQLIETQRDRILTAYGVLSVMGTLPQVVLGKSRLDDALKAPNTPIWGVSIPDVVPQGVDPVIQKITNLAKEKPAPIDDPKVKKTEILKS